MEALEYDVNRIVANCEVYNEAGAAITFLAQELVMRLHSIIRPDAVSSSSALSVPTVAALGGSSSSSSSAPHDVVSFNGDEGLVDEGVDEPLLFKLRVRRGNGAQQAMVDEAEDLAETMLVDGDSQDDDNSAGKEVEDDEEDDDDAEEDDEDESGDDKKRRRARSQPSRKPKVRLTLSSVRASRAAEATEAIVPSRPRRAAASKTVLREQSDYDDEDDGRFLSTGRTVRSSQRSSRRLRHHGTDDEQDGDGGHAVSEKLVRPVRSTRTSSTMAVSQESVVQAPSRSTRRSSRLPTGRIQPGDGGDDDDSGDEDTKGRVDANRVSSRSSRSHKQSLPTSPPPPQSIPSATVAPTARPQRLDREVKAHMHQLVAFVESLDTDKVFAYPVRAEEAPGYYDIVQSPMDLSTIQ